MRLVVIPGKRTIKEATSGKTFMQQKKLGGGKNSCTISSPNGTAWKDMSNIKALSEGKLLMQKVTALWGNE